MLSRACFALAVCAAGAFAQTGGWKMVWHDEFEGDRLDSSKWASVVGGDGFGNKELEYYTGRPRNLYLDGGMLAIRAIQEHFRGADGVEREFTSAADSYAGPVFAGVRQVRSAHQAAVWTRGSGRRSG